MNITETAEYLKTSISDIGVNSEVSVSEGSININIQEKMTAADIAELSMFCQDYATDEININIK